MRGQRVEGTTKGGRPRVVSIDRETVTILREHRRRQAAERQAAGPALTDAGGLVFATKWGEPLYPDTVTALMSKLITAYNKPVTAPERALPHARLHDLRHLYATTLQVSGVASDATFGWLSERLLPGAQRGGCIAGARRW
jgi:integrase